MARQAEELVSVKLPKTLPEGVETLQAERTLTGHPTKEGESNPKAVVSVLGPVVGSAEGVRNFIALRSDIGMDGVTDASNALRRSAFDIVPKLTLDNVKDSAALVLPFAGPRVIDPTEAFNAVLQGFHREKGRFPTAKEYQELHAAWTAQTGLV